MSCHVFEQRTFAELVIGPSPPRSLLSLVMLVTVIFVHGLPQLGLEEFMLERGDDRVTARDRGDAHIKDEPKAQAHAHQ